MKIKGLTRNAHGLWWYRPSAKGLPKGTPQPKAINLGTRDEDEAISELMKVRDLRRVDVRTLKEWAGVYRNAMEREKRHRAVTARQVKKALDDLGQFYGSRDVALFTDGHAAEWRGALTKAKLSESTIFLYLRYARAFFSWLASKPVKAIKENPLGKMKSPPARSRRDRFCTTEQRELLLEKCAREDVRFVLLAGFFCGMRINEIVNARWGWFQVEAGICTLQNEGEETGGFTVKNRKERVVPLHGRMADWLKSNAPKDRKDEDFILYPDKEQGKNWLRWDPRRPFDKIMTDCKLPWVTFHTMRHTFGSLHAIAGTAEIKIRRWMGITQQTWERHYAGLCPDDRDIDRI